MPIHYSLKKSRISNCFKRFYKQNRHHKVFKNHQNNRIITYAVLIIVIFTLLNFLN